MTKEQAAFGLLFFDPTMQEGDKAWLKALYAETNPYTGVPLAADAGVAVIQLQNEDSLLFWTFNAITGEPRKRLEKLFGDFLKSKYGSLDNAVAALLYRMGYVKRGEPAVHEERPLEDLFRRRSPIIAEGAAFDPNRHAGNLAPDASVKNGIHPLAFLVGPVEAVYGGQAKDSVVDLAKYIGESSRQVRSITGEITLDYGKGYCLLDAPKAQGVAAFFRNQNTFKTRDVEIASGNNYGTVLAVSMDDQPIAQSGKVLIQVGTQCRPSGWQERPVTIQVKEGRFPGLEVVDFGKAPWQVVRPDVRLAIANPRLTRATVLDANGNAVGQAKLTKAGERVQVTFPDNAMYVVLQ